MTDAAGWLVAGVQGALVLAALAFSADALRRIGAACHYGQLFLINTLGLWLLFSGFLLFNFRSRVLDVWSPGPTIGDVPYFLAYVLLVASFAALALRFRSWRGAGGGGRVAALVIAAPAVAFPAALLVLIRFVSPAQPIEGFVWMRLAYTALDGAGLGAVALAFVALRRAGHSVLSRFYLVFGFALAVNSVADLSSAVIATLGARSVAVDLLYVVAGAFLVVAFWDHDRLHRRLGASPLEPVESALEGLGVPVHERVLAAFVRAHEPLIGSATHALLSAGVDDASRALGTPVSVLPDGRVRGARSSEEWDVVLRSVRDRFRSAVGHGASRDVLQVVRRFGRDFAFLAF